MGVNLTLGDLGAFGWEMWVWVREDLLYKHLWSFSNSWRNVVIPESPMPDSWPAYHLQGAPLLF
jgi:hypothetical protein